MLGTVANKEKISTKHGDLILFMIFLLTLLQDCQIKFKN